MTSINTNAISSDLLGAMNGATKSKSTDEATDKFLTLLVTQMKNQDPLNPMDNAQVTSQMAQLSTVTGVNQVNSTLQGLRGDFQANQTFQASGLIDRAVLASGNTLSLTNGGSVFGFNLDSAADNVVVSIKDSSGAVVRTFDAGAGNTGSNPSQWDGRTDGGSVAPNGEYTFSVTATSGESAVKAAPLAYAMVNSVSSGPNGVKLNLGNGNSITMADVRQIL